MIRKALLSMVIIFSAATAYGAVQIEEIKTPSGYTVWLAEDHTLPIMTVRLSFEHSGSAYEPAGKEGLASFVSQMMDEGAGDMDSLAFHRALENKAIRYSVEAGEDNMSVALQTLSEHKDEALRLLLLSLTKPRFDAEATSRIRDSIVSDLVQLEQEPDYIASRTWKELAFPGHAYSHPRRGTIESLKTITGEDLHQFAAVHFFAGTAPIIAVVGDVTADDIRGWPFPPLAHSAASAPVADVTPPDGKELHKVAHDVPQTVVLASLPSVSRTDPRYYTLLVLNQILGGDSITSRLGSEIRNKRGLAYHVSTDIEIMDHTAFISANFATRGPQAKEALAVFDSVLKDVSEKGVTEDELKNAKNYLIGSFPLDHDTQNGLAGLLIGIQHFHLGMDYLQKHTSLIEKVSLQDVNALARSFLSHPPLVVMVGKQ